MEKAIKVRWRCTLLLRFVPSFSSRFQAQKRREFGVRGFSDSRVSTSPGFLGPPFTVLGRRVWVRWVSKIPEGGPTSLPLDRSPSVAGICYRIVCCSSSGRGGFYPSLLIRLKSTWKVQFRKVLAVLTLPCACFSFFCFL